MKDMKKLIFLLPIVLFSCEKEEKPELTILGKWNCYEIEQNGNTYPRDFTFEFKRSYDSFFIDGRYYGTWTKDLTTLYISPQDDYPFTYAIISLTDKSLVLRREFPEITVTYYFHRME